MDDYPDYTERVVEQRLLDLLSRTEPVMQKIVNSYLENYNDAIQTQILKSGQIYEA
jgi:hypothetical protein